MDRESKFRMVLLLAAAAVTAVVLTGLYSARPLEFYQVTVEATPAPAAASSQVQPTQEPAGETIPVEEDTSSEGPQEVLVEKSVNLNTATLEELDLLPGVGLAIAQRIIDYREQNSGFYDIEEIMEVSGIGETSQWNKKERWGSSSPLFLCCFKLGRWQRQGPLAFAPAP